MAPKAVAEGDNSAMSQAITVLCEMMSSAGQLSINSQLIAEKLGIAHAKNVPRKINGIINPYGFEFKNSEVKRINNDGESVPATPSDTADAPAAPPKAKKLPTPRKKADAASTDKKVKKASPTKKRKLDEDEAEVKEDADSGEKTEISSDVNGDGESSSA